MSKLPAGDAPGTDPATLLTSVVAPAQWRAVDFVSDLHLHAGDDATWLAWQHYLQNTTAQAIFILGDLFEVWVGDDVLAPSSKHGVAVDTGFETQCVEALRQARQRLELFFTCGNRDFLLSALGFRACGMQALADPCLLQLGSQRWVLSHGDALCLDDVDYQQFRAMVRSTAWQAEFLAQPLARRQTVARQLRAQSELHKSAHPVPSTVDTPATMQWLREANASTLIHGHTHQPADHALAHGLRRIVLSDWDLNATPPRAQVLRLTLDDASEPVDLRRLWHADAC